jgi:L-ascorbate metabolism protein UlaG (beta-lactamase superfamily)
MKRILLSSVARAAGALAMLLGAPAAAAKPRDSLSAVWIGGPTLLFRFGPITLVTDPVLGESFRMIDPNSGAPDALHRRFAPLPDVAVEDADLVLVSHDHADHLDEAALARLGRGSRFIVPLAQAGTLNARGARQVLGLPWRASHTIRKNGYSVRITAVPAQHSEKPALLKVLGEVNGYWIEFRHRRFRRTVYWTGDSFPVPAELGPETRAPDLLVPHLGGVGEGGPFGQVSMGAREAIALARVVKPRRVLPIHHSTFSLYREPVDLFTAEAAREPWKTERLDEGEELVLP